MNTVDPRAPNPTLRPSTLVFPSTVPEAHAEARRRRRSGRRIVGAASLAPNHPPDTFDDWFRLPTIYEPDFLEALAFVCSEANVTSIVAPSAAVHDRLAAWADEGRLPCELTGAPPIRAAMEEWARLSERAAAAIEWIECVTGQVVDPTLVKAVLTVPTFVHGESSEDKLVGLCAAALTAPAGDFIEIGVSMGRSASVLALMARERSRSLITVDPWTAEDMVQHDVASSLNALMSEWSPDRVADAFSAHMRLVTDGPFAHLRLPSVDAAARYETGAYFSTVGFSTVFSAGRVGLLHIDGNHDLLAVTTDWEAWSPYLAEGAWVVIDDYQWVHGDGPRRVADDVLAAHPRAMEGAFCTGSALFFRWRPPAP